MERSDHPHGHNRRKPGQSSGSCSPRRQWLRSEAFHQRPDQGQGHELPERKSCLRGHARELVWPRVSRVNLREKWNGMVDQDILRTSLLNNSREVFGTMLGMEVEEDGSQPEPELPDNPRVAALIGF